ncbi:MAG: glycosyltransferase family 2 protein [Candidatus Cyclobacteriaceae bacterium M2_1C_046]
MKDFSIIIPTFERQEIFNKTLAAAHKAIENIDAEIIVVNDSKKSKLKITIDSNKIKVLNNPGKGVASARNFGASQAVSGHLIFLDDDILITKTAVEQAKKHIQEDKNNCYLFNWFYPPQLIDKLSKSKFGRYLEKYQFTSLKGWIGPTWKESTDVFELSSGASYFLPITADNFRRVGGYNESFPHAGAEDYEFSQRALKMGIKFYLDKTVTVFHNEEDRLNMNNWLDRKRRNGETIRVAYELGYKELEFSYSPLKKIAYRILGNLKPLLIFTFHVIPNTRTLDPVSFRIIHLLLGTHLYEGYYKSELK